MMMTPPAHPILIEATSLPALKMADLTPPVIPTLPIIPVQRRHPEHQREQSAPFSQPARSKSPPLSEPAATDQSNEPHDQDGHINDYA